MLLPLPVKAHPEKRYAQRLLAEEVTEMVHGGSSSIAILVLKLIQLL